MLNGFSVIVSPDIPKMKLVPGDYVSASFRVEIDAWLLEFFGTTNLIADGESMVSEATQTIWINPRGYADLKSMTN